jgi:hypothetical protein
MWHKRRIFSQDARKFRPARPQFWCRLRLRFSEDQAPVFLNLDLSLNLPESWRTFSAFC